MELTILYDNASCGASFQSGWGFSCLADGCILFDTGEAPASLFHNMAQLKVDPDRIEAVVISHDHWDHTGGLWELLKRRKGLKVYACPGFSGGFKQKVKTLEGCLIESGGFQEIDARISVTGEIPGQYNGEYLPEQALMVKTESGTAVVTGCSHPGIVTMIEKVKDLFPEKPVVLVLGGFHLKNENSGTIRSIASALMKTGVLRVGPTHCTGKDAQIVFRELFGNGYMPLCAGKHLEV